VVQVDAFVRAGGIFTICEPREAMVPWHYLILPALWWAQLPPKRRIFMSVKGYAIEKWWFIFTVQGKYPFFFI